MSKRISEEERRSRENYKKKVDETFGLPSQTSSKANSEAVKNGLGLDIVMPKDPLSVNFDKLNRISSLMARTQRI